MLLLAGGAVLAQSGGSYDVAWQVLGSAGEQFVAGSGYQLGFTLAQDTPPLVSQGSGYQVVQGYWSGGGGIPTAVTLTGFWVEPRGDALWVRWETASEIDVVGFHLYRSEGNPAGPYSRLNEGLIPAQSPGSSTGAPYDWIDGDVVEGVTYYYLLEGLDAQGRTTEYGPLPAALAAYRIYLPFVSR
jgi:hypothetical protein